MCRRAQRRVAVSLAILWLLAVEVLPNLHLAVHEDDHTHEADGSITRHHHDHDESGHHDEPRDHDESDHHDEVDHHDHDEAGRDADPPKRSRSSNQLAIEHAPTPHAAAGIAHHACALLDPPPPLTAPVALRHFEVWVHANPIGFVDSAATAWFDSRGPPAS